MPARLRRDRGEVAPVEGRDLLHAQPLSDRDHGGVGGAQRERGEGSHQLCHAGDVIVGEIDKREAAVSNGVEEGRLRLGSDPLVQPVAGLSENR